VSYISIDSNATIVQSVAPPDPTGRRNYIYLGAVIHSNNVIINTINNLPAIALDYGAQLGDLMYALGFWSISGNLISGNDGNLKIDKSLGTAFKPGSNFNTLKSNPHIITLPAQVAATFRYRTQTSVEGSDVSTLDVTHWDNAGTVTVFSSGTTIQRVYIFASGLIRIQYGQEVFSSFSTAISQAGTENFVTEDNIAENGMYLASIVVRHDATDLSDTADAVIIPASGITGSGTSSSFATLQQSYDISNVPHITTSLNTPFTIIGDVSISGFLDVEKIQFETDPSTIYKQGNIYYDKTWQTISAEIGRDVTLQIGQEDLRRVYNDTGSTIYNGKAVYVTGVHSDWPKDCVTVALAKSNEASTAYVLGLATQDISNNDYGFITVRGHVNDLNTDVSGWNVGNILYLSDTSSGELVNTIPTAPSLEIRVARLITKSASVGRLDVILLPQTYRLGDLADVTITSPSTNQFLKYNGNEWVNVSENAFTSIFATNASIGLADFAKNASLSLYTLKTVFDSSISSLTTRLNTTDASLIATNAYQTIQDASIAFALNSILGDVMNANSSTYVSMSGSDVSGDGTYANPYKTIYKALSTIDYNMNGYTAYINLMPGTFYYDASCDFLRTNQVNGEVLLRGSLILDISNAKFVQPNPTTDPFTYNVSVNDLTPSWTTNQWRKYFIDVNTGVSSTTIRPIANSSTWTMEVADTSLIMTPLNVYHQDSSIVFTSNSYTGQVQIEWSKIILLQNTEFSPISNNFDLINRGNLIQSDSSTTHRNLTLNKTIGVIGGSYFDDVKIIIDKFSNLFAAYCVFYLKNTTTLAYSCAGVSTSFIYTSIFDRYSSGGYGIGYYENSAFSPNLTQLSNYYLKFKNINYPFYITSGGTIELLNLYKIILDKCDYFFRLGGNIFPSKTAGKFIIDADIIGAPTIRYFYDSGTLFERYYNPIGMDFHIKNVLYREYDPLYSTKIYNNTSIDISIGHTSQNKSISIDYTVQRGFGYADGMFTLVTDGSNFSTSVDRYTSTGTAYSAVDDPAVQFDILTDASIIKWRVTLDSSGGDASLNYSINRVMKYPLTL
jgi:hypothetical protein